MRALRAATVVVLGAVVGGVGGPAAAASEPTGGAWEDYRLGQFITSRGTSPADILDLDNNGQILLACRDGCTLASLEGSGVPALASQLELLRAWALLGTDGSYYRTAIPIVDGEDAAYMAELADGLAAKLSEAIGADVAELVAALAVDGHGEHAWTVVFAYVLDGAVWRFLRELEAIEPRGALHRGAPWGGEVWAYVGGGEPATSTIRRPSLEVKMTWVEALRPQVMSVLRGPDGIATLIEALVRGETESDEVRARLQQYGILGPQRQVTVPLIDETSEHEVFAICERLTERVATTVASKLDGGALVNDFGFESESQAMVVGYHEVMWSLMDRLVADGALKLPAAIADPSAAVPADLGKLVVMVRSAPGESSGAEPQGPARDED